MDEVGYMGAFPRRGARRTWVIPVAVVVALSMLGLPSAPVEAQPPAMAPAVHRVAGGDRVATAAAVSAAHWSSAEDALLATAGNYPDALAAGTLAASLDAPLLLTGTDSLAPAAAAELQRLGVERVHLMGGPAAVSAAVEAALVEQGYAVHRIAGTDRHRTAAAVAREAGPAASGDVVLALGGHADPTRAWPDALSAGGLAATADRPPLLLTDGESLPPVTEEALSELSGGEDRRVLLAGGPGAIGASVEARLQELGHTVVRLAGGSRFETSTRVADAVLRRMSTDPRPLVIASGANFPDGLAAAALAARVDGVVLLVPPDGLDGVPALSGWLTAMGPRFDEVIAVGGPSAVSDLTVTQVTDALGRPIAPLAAPTPVPSGAVPEMARQLVAAVTGQPAALGQEPDSTDDAAGPLLTALSQAGFTVLQSDGSIVTGPSGGHDQGLVFEAWEVAAIADIASHQREGDLTSLGTDISTLDDLLADAPVADFLLAGVRDAAADPSSPSHVWAWLLVEAGRQAPVPHDLLSDPAEAVQLTQLQHALLLRRLVGDLMAWANAEAEELEDEGASTSSWARTRQAVPGTGRPCTLDPNTPAEKILDHSALVSSTAFGQLLGYIEDAGVPGVAKLNSTLGVAGVMATVGQLVVTYTALKTTMDLETPGPIVRTPEADAGEDHTLVTTVRLNAGNWRLVTCFRFLLNAVGLDFSVPPDGPLKDIEVDTPFIGAEPGFGLEGQPSTGPNGVETFEHKVTNAQGQVRTYITGRARSRSLDPDLIVGYERTQSMLTKVVLSPADIFTDFKDVGTTILSGVTGGPAAFIAELSANLVRRTRWFGNKVFPIPYIDFREDCSAAAGAFTQDAPEEPPLVCGPRTLTGQIGYSWTVHTVPNDRGETHSGGAHVTVNANLVADGTQPGSYVDDGSSSFEVAMDWETVTVSGECTDRVRYTGSDAGTFTEGEGIHYLHHDGQAEQDLFYVPVGHVTVTTTLTTQGPPQCSPSEFSYDEEHWLSLACPSPGFLFQDTDGLQGTASYDGSGFTQLDLGCSVEVQHDTIREVKDVTGILRHGG